MAPMPERLVLKPAPVRIQPLIRRLHEIEWICERGRSSETDQIRELDETIGPSPSAIPDSPDTQRASGPLEPAARAVREDQDEAVEASRPAVIGL